jgi:hypothetical protein
MQHVVRHSRCAEESTGPGDHWEETQATVQATKCDEALVEIGALHSRNNGSSNRKEATAATTSHIGNDNTNNNSNNFSGNILHTA